MERLSVHYAVSFLFFLTAYPAYSLDAAFTWPESYMVTIAETSKTEHTQPFFVAYRRDGLKVRNQFVRDGRVEIEIFRLDQHKKICIHSSGTIEEGYLPPDWPMSSIQALYVTMWLTMDKKTPLRLEDGDAVVEFLNYGVGRQDPSLFETTTK